MNVNVLCILLYIVSIFIGNGLGSSMVRHYAKRVGLQCTNSVG
jgi:hypothetical protein